MGPGRQGGAEARACDAKQVGQRTAQQGWHTRPPSPRLAPTACPPEYTATAPPWPATLLRNLHCEKIARPRLDTSTAVRGGGNGCWWQQRRQHRPRGSSAASARVLCIAASPPRGAAWTRMRRQQQRTAQSGCHTSCQAKPTNRAHRASPACSPQRTRAAKDARRRAVLLAVNKGQAANFRISIVACDLQDLRRLAADQSGGEVCRGAAGARHSRVDSARRRPFEAAPTAHPRTATRACVPQAGSQNTQPPRAPACRRRRRACRALARRRPSG